MLKVSTCFQHCSSCSQHGDCALVFVVRVMWTYKGDVNSASGENRKKPLSSKISIEASFISESNEETLNVNRTCQQ